MLRGQCSSGAVVLFLSIVSESPHASPSLHMCQGGHATASFIEMRLGLGAIVRVDDSLTITTSLDIAVSIKLGSCVLILSFLSRASDSSCQLDIFFRCNTRSPLSFLLYHILHFFLTNISHFSSAPSTSPSSLIMGGKVWSIEEERIFWEEIIPCSPNAANPAARKLSWKQCVDLMRERIGSNARRDYTVTMLCKSPSCHACVPTDHTR